MVTFRGFQLEWIIYKEFIMCAGNIKKLNTEVCVAHWTQQTHCAAWGEKQINTGGGGEEECKPLLVKITSFWHRTLEQDFERQKTKRIIMDFGWVGFGGGEAWQRQKSSFLFYWHTHTHTRSSYYPYEEFALAYTSATLRLSFCFVFQTLQR